MIIEIKPMDTLFFRDGKPFNKGEETWANTSFLPTPATIYGALRAAYFNENIDIFEKLKRNNKLNSEQDPTTSLKIKSILLKRGNDYLFQLPRNVLQYNKKIKVLNDSNNNFLTSKSNIGLLINDEDSLFVHNKSWINEIGFEDYLKKNYTNLNFQTEKNLFISEPKVGISLNSLSHTSDESNLYRADMIRLKDDISFVVEFDGLEIVGKFIKFGGEGKFVFAEKINSKCEIAHPEIDKQFLLYLATPAIFLKGWIPSWIDENSLIGIFPNTKLKVKLLSATLGKPDLIGGFDMAKRKPKPMFKAVPAGSVYLFEIMEGEASSLKMINNNSISDINPEQGFGICYIGKI